jgi:putative FmdB family regulatory protein
MATYEYFCKICTASLSISRSITEPDPGYRCQQCNEQMVKRYAGANLGITFNGSGFYSKEK